MHNFDLQIAAPRRYTREASANAAEHVGAYRSWGDGASGGASAGTADQPPSARCVLSRKSTTRSTAAACVALRAPPSASASASASASPPPQSWSAPPRRRRG